MIFLTWLFSSFKCCIGHGHPHRSCRCRIPLLERVNFPITLSYLLLESSIVPWALFLHGWAHGPSIKVEVLQVVIPFGHFGGWEVWDKRLLRREHFVDLLHALLVVPSVFKVKIHISWCLISIICDPRILRVGPVLWVNWLASTPSQISIHSLGYHLVLSSPLEDIQVGNPLLRGTGMHTLQLQGSKSTMAGVCSELTRRDLRFLLRSSIRYNNPVLLIKLIVGIMYFPDVLLFTASWLVLLQLYLW